MAQLTAILLFVTIVFHLSLGIIAFNNNPKALVNRYLLSLSISTAMWTFAVLMVTLNAYPDALLFWIRASYAMGIIIPWHIFALASTFQTRYIKYNMLTFLLITGSIAFFGIAFMPNFIISINDPMYAKEPVFGNLYFSFITFYVFAVIVAIVQLFKKLSSSIGIKRLQVKYLLIGTLASITLSTIANVILPSLGFVYFNQLDVRSLGPVFSITLVGMVTYAIVRYRFMDIRFAFRKYFSLLITSFLLAGLAIMIIRSFYYYEALLGWHITEFFIVIIVIFFVFSLPIIKKWSQNLIESFLYKNVVDYHSILPKQIRSLENILEYNSLLQELIKLIINYMNLDHGFYSRKNNQGNYEPSNVIIKNAEIPCSARLEENISAVVEYVLNNKEILLKTDLKSEIEGEHLIIEQIMDELGLEVVVPFILENEVEGLLFLGVKRTREPFYSEDIDLISSIVSQINSAFINARLYEEILAIKQYLENILLNMGNSLVAINEEEVITVFNAEAEKIFGISADKALGQKIFPFMNKDIYVLFQKTLEKGEGIDHVEIKLKLDRKTRYLTCNTAIVESPEKRNREIIIVLNDVTRIKELEQERSKSERLVSLGEVAAGIAHEIKNPLVSIKTFADLLPEKYEDDDFRHKFSNVVSQEIIRINDLVGELLSFVKEPVLHCAQVNIIVLIEEVISLLSPQLEAYRIAINYHFQEELLSASVDRSLLKQALLNICLNAIQAMPNGGRMIVGVSFSETDLTIFIEDTGTGIADSIREKIFDPFVTNKADGVGLGLSICHKIISAHGGRIILKSDEGNGSRFEIVLPRS